MRIHTLVMMVCLVLSVFQVQAADPPPPPASLLSINPGAELWREVRQREGEVEVLGGLAEGDRVISEGIIKVRDGVTVRVLDDTQPYAEAASGQPRKKRQE